ncbi:MAG: AAA family ATPase [Bacteroidales bacterium]|nr:AAA family ATPase [Bacteroidales bacterium]MBR6929220.1 AAA family ATPase [Bacteroidales bacterium]
MQTFKKGEKIDKYVINSFVKKGAVAESYTVLGSDDMMYFMKVYDFEKIPHEQLFQGKEVYEIQLCKELNTDENQNVVRYVDNGEVKKSNTVYHYLVTEFYRGTLLLDAVRTDGRFDLEDAVQITLCVLSGLSFIHSRALIHNDIRPSNIMLQELEDGMLMPTIIDLGHISYMVKGRPTFADEDLMPYFRAPETFRSVYTVKSDIFSTGALLYFLIFGKSPWEGLDLRVFEGDKQKIADALKKARKQDLILETVDVQLPDYMKAILLKALAKKPDDRFASAADFAQALFEQMMPELAKRMEEEEAKPQAETQNNSGPTITFKKGSGSGFDNVTGRDELKEQLRKEVLFALQNPEKAKLYKLPAINGVLLYGPPGCGKSLVLNSFAEELGFNYTIIHGPEMGHIYQDGVLDNLQRMFDAAEIKAPFVICIDELEFLAPNPNGEGEENVTPQISALYGMMNECSKKGILVVATTNRPDLIDQSIMRIGCFDRVFFVPQPDFEARKDIFMDHLKDRPCEELDFDELAKMSDDFNAGDITEAVNEAAMTAAYNDVPISQKILVDVLKYKNPTYSTKTRIGFNKSLK